MFSNNIITTQLDELMSTLTKRQKEILDFLVNFERIKGYMPTLREIAEEFKVSHQAIDKLLRKLEKKEYIEIMTNENRGIKILKNVNANTIQMAKEIESSYQLYKNNRITEEEYNKIRNKIIDSFLS